MIANAVVFKSSSSGIGIDNKIPLLILDTSKIKFDSTTKDILSPFSLLSNS